MTDAPHVATEVTPNIPPSTEALIQFNPFVPEFRDNPYLFYAELREADPVHWAEGFGFWVISRYADCVTMLRNSHGSTNPRDWERYNDYVASLGGEGAAYDMQSKWMLLKNPPDHTRLRKLVTKAFTPRVVEGMRPHIQNIVDDLLDQVQAKGHFDIIGDLAFPLPVIVIAELIGVPVDDRDQFKEWTGALARSLDPVVTPEIVEAANDATDSFVEYFVRLVAKRRAQPQEDMLSALIAVEEEGDRLTEDELLSNVILLFAAGHETTMNLIGNGMLALFRNPDQLTKLKAEPSLIQTAVEEFLRYDGSVQITARVVLEDLEIGGKLIRKNQQSLILLGAANHDPAQFVNPDQLDITRQDNPHITFSHGIHHCLGAPLARVEAQIAVNTLLRRMPDITLASESVEWREMITLRGLRALPVTC